MGEFIPRGAIVFAAYLAIASIAGWLLPHRGSRIAEQGFGLTGPSGA